MSREDCSGDTIKGRRYGEQNGNWDTWIGLN